MLYSVHLTCRRSGFDPRTGQTCKSLFLKHVMTSPLLSAMRSAIGGSGDDHYKGVRITVYVAHSRTLTAQWPRVPSKG